MPELIVSSFQQRVLAIPEEYDIALTGGRGGSKSYTMCLIALRHAEQYKQHARMLYVRQSYKGIADFESICLEIFSMVYGKGVKYNAAEHVFKFPNGAYLELGQLEGPRDYSKYQGRSFTLLLKDEIGQYATPELLDKLRSNMRGPKDMPIREVVAANPGAEGHYWVATRYVFKSAPWAPFTDEKTKRSCVNAPSTFLDNPFIDQEHYRAQLEASCPSDPELLSAWLAGNWAIARGAYFGGCVDESRNAIDPWQKLPPEPNEWHYYLAHDFGSSAPSVTYIVALSPGAEGPDGKFYSKDSIVLIDELATNEPGSLTKGLGWTVPKLSEAIVATCNHWGIDAYGVADDACFASHGHSAGSISDEFRRGNVWFRSAKKGDRITGWNIMRRLLSDAGKPDVPGLYIARNCEYFWATVPYLARDPRRIEDLDSRGPDHAADAARYGCLYDRPFTGRLRIVGV